MGVVVPARHFKKAGLKLTALLAATSALSACAGKGPLANLKNPFWHGGTPEPVVAQTIGPEVAQPAVVAVAPLDPINAPPPMTTTTTTVMADSMLVPMPSATPASDSSQRVPLGTLSAPAPSGAPTSLMQPPAPQPMQVRPSAQAPMQKAAAPTNVPQQIAVAVPARTTESAIVTPPAKAAAPALRQPLGRPSSATSMLPEPKEPEPPPEEPQETVVISSATAKPVIQSREFVPASLVPGQTSITLRGLDDLPMKAGEKNVVQRFETLRRLKDESLITDDEYARRRAANIGALLPYTRDPGGVGLERSVPSSDAIIARLAGLRRAFEMRAISAAQHALERTMILNALLPEAPEERDEQKAPPADVIEGAAMVGRLEGLRAKNLITTAELDAERDAIEHVLRTGLLPSQETGANKKASAKSAAAAKPKTTMTATAEADPMSAEITGPVLHLASYRTEASAKQGWIEVISHNKAALASLKPIIRKVDLGAGQGIFYRLMAGTFNSLSDAEAVCIQLKQNNQFCRASADGS